MWDSSAAFQLDNEFREVLVWVKAFQADLEHVDGLPPPVSSRSSVGTIILARLLVSRVG